MENRLKDTGFMKWLWSHKIAILITEVVACAAAVVFTDPHFITPKFKSYAVIYPYNLMPFAREDVSEQMLQFLYSVDIKDSVCKEFNLYKHYRIDTTKKFWYTELHKEYESNVSVTMTKFEALEVTVYDRSADTACKLAKAIVAALNRKILATQKEKSVETANMFKRMMEGKKKQVDSLAAITRQLSVQYGLLNYDEQSREVSRAYYSMLAAGKGGKAMDEVSTEMKNLEEKGQIFNEENAHLASCIGEYDGLRLRYEDAMKDVNKKITYSIVVETPYPADKKAFPVRWLITVIAAAGTFMFSVIVLGFLDRFKK